MALNPTLPLRTASLPLGLYINTLMIQEILSEKDWLDKMQVEDLSALTPLIYSHVNPYGIFELNMDERIPLNVT